MNASDFIPYARQWIEEDDIAAVVDVLRSPYLTTGPKVKEFESAVAAYTSGGTGVAFSSGTAALHAALYAAGIGPGDEVLVPTLSFAATANAVLYVGAKPVFVDSVENGFNLDPTDIARKITPKTKAIIPVHFAGEPVDLDVIHGLARQHRLVVIEDAAHALGALYRGKSIGGLSDMTVFSFHPVKHITTAEGGMVMTHNEAWAKRLRRFRHHGIDVDVVERDAQKQWSYDMVDLGFNYRLSDMQCALGASQLKKAERFVERRQAIASEYDRTLGAMTGVMLPPRPDAPGRHSWHLYVVRLDAKVSGFSRDEVFRRLREVGVGVHVHYRPIHLHSYYRKLGWKIGDCPRAEQTFLSMLSLPIYPALTDEMQKRVIDCLQMLLLSKSLPS